MRNLMSSSKSLLFLQYLVLHYSTTQLDAQSSPPLPRPALVPPAHCKISSGLTAAIEQCERRRCSKDLLRDKLSQAVATLRARYGQQQLATER